MQVLGTFTETLNEVRPWSDSCRKDKKCRAEPGNVVYAFESSKDVPHKVCTGKWREDGESKEEELSSTELGGSESGYAI